MPFIISIRITELYVAYVITVVYVFIENWIIFLYGFLSSRNINNRNRKITGKRYFLKNITFSLVNMKKGEMHLTLFFPLLSRFCLLHLVRF